MPHCIIEYSKDLEQTLSSKQLLNATFQGALASELFSEGDIKTRTVVFDHYQSGTIKSSFIHVTARILSGRNLAQRTLLSTKILAELTKLSCKSTSLTVEVVEIEKSSYAKIVTH